MKLKMPKAQLHNNFKVVVKNSKTGEIEQEAFAYNTVLRAQELAHVMYKPSQTNSSCGSKGVARIDIGTGTGTVSPEDVSLFTPLATIPATVLERTVEMPLSTVRLMVTLGETSYVGSTITEIGLSGEYKGSSSGTLFPRLLTHALLQDSEGNPIVIGPKTDTQIIEIYATAYVEINTELGSDFTWNNPNVYNLALAGDSYTHLILGGLTYYPSGVAKSRSRSVNGNVVTLTGERLLSTEGNAAGGPFDITKLDLPNIGYLTFPNADLFPDMSFIDREIGPGDGLTTAFSLDSGYIKEATLDVKVDTVLKTLGTDYTIQNNAGANFFAAGSLKYPIPGVSQSITYTYDGTDIVIDEYTGALVPPMNSMTGILFKNGHSIVADFGAPVSLDYFYAVYSTGYNRSTIMEYSEDNTNWYPCVNGTVATARYFRLRNNGSYSVELSYVIMRSTKTVFFTTPPGLVTGESLGTGDDLETDFVLSNTPIDGSVTVYVDGVEVVLDTDYTLAGGTITFGTAPATGAVITADYRYSVSVTATWDTEYPPKTADFAYDFTVDVDFS